MKIKNRSRALVSVLRESVRRRYSHHQGSLRDSKTVTKTEARDTLGHDAEVCLYIDCTNIYVLSQPISACTPYM